MRGWAVLLVLLALPLGLAQGLPTAWIQLDDTRPEDPGDAPTPADMVDLYFSPTATHMYFREDLAALPDVGNYTYTIYIDFPRGGGPVPDFRLVHSASGSYLEQWDGSAWIFVEPINVTVEPTNTSLIFEVSYASLGGFGDDHLDVTFENYDGADSFQDPLDRAPNGNQPYRVHKRTIPNLPWVVLPLFAGGLIAAVLVLRRALLPKRRPAVLGPSGPEAHAHEEPVED
ncbi:MAG: hypothetical protein ACE5I4_02145 [Thermoplasmata archaeon]